MLAPTLATAGTIFQDIRIALTLWCRVIWLGVHAASGWASYRTTRTWLHQLRRAMVRPGRDHLTHVVEVDETFVGGVEPGGGKRHVGKKALVVVAAEVRGRAIGRIRPALAR